MIPGSPILAAWLLVGGLPRSDAELSTVLYTIRLDIGRGNSLGFLFETIKMLCMTHEGLDTTYSLA